MVTTSAHWLDQKYANLISPRLERFKRAGAGFTFRCPMCGDSKRNKSKCRGYLYVAKNKTYRFQCFNCDFSCSFDSFLKFVDPNLYGDYKTERFAEKQNTLTTHTEEADQEEPVEEETEQTPEKKIEYMRLLSTLPNDHIAVEYCEKRMIPRDKFDRIGYVYNFHQYVVNGLGLEKYLTRPLPRDKRIVLEMRSPSGVLYGLQARAIESNSKSLRYITLKTKDTFPKIYGLDRLTVGENTPVFVTEGPIDSLFLPNAVAVCGGDISILEQTLVKMGFDRENIFVLLDNEPRSKDTVTRMQKAINLGYQVMFWDVASSLKDINDMIKAGITTRDILASIKKNSKSGANAKVALMKWKKL